MIGLFFEYLHLCFENFVALIMYILHDNAHNCGDVC